MSTPAAVRWVLACALAMAANAPALAQDAPPCAERTTNEALVVALEAAASSYDALEIEAFEKAAEQGVAAVGCLGEPITRSTAAELHRTLGILAYVRREETPSKVAFAAARAIEPSYTFPVDRVPQGNPMLEYYTAVDPTLLQVTEAPYPRSGSVRLDGSAERKRIEGLPVVFQQLDEAGAVSRSVLLGAGDPLPEYPVRTDPTTRKGPQRSTLIAGLVVGAAAGAVYGGAVASRAQYDKATSPEDKIAIRPVTNGLVIASGTIGVVAVGLGTVSLVNGRF